ncbi:MAG: dihydroorotate dehydrogenase-like protein [Deltaproteobacteria bacterium]|nr:dihydroorotate dehydrogenase-like protein [Deltaproteobacteria bacterium]
MADLTTRYLGLELECPLIVGSSSLTRTVQGIRRCEDAGAGAVVVKSLFEEQIRMEFGEAAASLEADAHPEALQYLQADAALAYGPRAYLELLERAARDVRIPVIASVNCISPRGWAGFARQIEAAGARALELNIFVLATHPGRTSEEIEWVYLDTVKTVRAEVKIPVAVKLVPFLTSVPSLAARMVDAGANGLVLFNRFFHPDIDVTNLRLAGGLSLSSPDDNLIPLRWIALLHGRVRADLCASGGVHDAAAVVRSILAGATATQVTSALYRNGVEYLSVLRDGVASWMDGHGFRTLEAFRGRLSRSRAPDPTLYERAQYIKAFVDAE